MTNEELQNFQNIRSDALLLNNILGPKIDAFVNEITNALPENAISHNALAYMYLVRAAMHAAFVLNAAGSDHTVHDVYTVLEKLAALTRAFSIDAPLDSTFELATELSTELSAARETSIN